MKNKNFIKQRPSGMNMEEFERLMSYPVRKGGTFAKVQLCALLMCKGGLRYQEVQEIPMEQLLSGEIRITNPLTHKKIEQHMPEVKAFMVENGIEGMPSEKIFANLNHVSMNNQLRQLCKDCFIESPFMLNTLRRFHRIHFVKNASANPIAEILGHSSFSQTEKYMNQ